MERHDEPDSYHGRWQAARDRRCRIEVVVPAICDGAVYGIAAGSAMVVADEAGTGTGNADGRVVVHYEGWVHGASHLEGLDARGRWEHGVHHAAGRAVTRYPTAACCALERAELVHVGWYDVVSEAVEVDDEDSLYAWLAAQ